MKGSPSKRIELKIHVIGPEDILLAGSSVPHSAQRCYRLGKRKGCISLSMWPGFVEMLSCVPLSLW